MKNKKRLTRAFGIWGNTDKKKFWDFLDDILICSSYSKNFGLYSERVGCLIYKSNNENKSEKLLSQLKKNG